MKGDDNPLWDWVAYWDELDEGQLLFREEADEYVRNLAAAVRLDRGMRVLDFGCGYGFVAHGLAPLVGQLFLWDAAESMRACARSHLAGRPNVYILGSPGTSDAPGDPRFDLILVNSVIQYMSEAEFLARLATWCLQLAPGGQVVVSDIIPPDHPPLKDILALLSFSTRRGYLLRALRNVLGERKRYQRMKQMCRLYHVGADQLHRHAAASGLQVKILPRNLTHFPGRITAVFSLGADDRRRAPHSCHADVTSTGRGDSQGKGVSGPHDRQETGALGHRRRRHPRDDARPQAAAAGPGRGPV